MIPREDSSLPPLQRSPRTDPDLRDGDSAHGNPGEPAGDRNAVDSDTDVEEGPAAATPERQEEFGNLVQEYEGDGRENEAPPAPVPLNEYGRLTVPEVVRRAKGLEPNQLAELLEFERTHRNRKTLVARLARMSAGDN